MASIPDIPDTSPSLASIGNPITPVSDRRVAGYNAGLPAAALAKLGGTAEDISNDWMTKQNEVAKAQALSNTFSDVIGAQKKAELEPDPQKAQELYTNARNESIQKNAGLIPGLVARQEFNARVGIEMHRIDSAFEQNLVAKQKQAGLAAIDQTTQDSINSFSQTSDSDTRAAIVQQHQIYLTTMKNNGVITPEQFQKMTKDYSRQASLAYYEMHPNELAPDLQKRLGTTSVPSPGVQPTAQDVSTAILGHESDNGQNTATSAKGAVGAGQILPETFAQYAKPGESIVNNADNLAVHKRIIDDYMQRYNGDASRVAVAYISGPGNVAPAGSPTPWIKDKNDGNENVSDYVANVNKRLGVSPQLVSANDNKTGKPIDNIPAYEALQVAQLAESRGNILGKIQEQQQKKQALDTQNKYIDQGLKGQSLTDMFNDHSMTPEQRSQVIEYLDKVARFQDKTDPGAFNELWKRTLLPDGDPHKLTDPQELLAYGDKLSNTDRNTLQKQVLGGEEGEEELKAFWKQGHDQLSKSSMMDIDQEGERRAYNWHMATQQAIDAGMKAGHSLRELINPTSKFYVGNNINQFQEDLATQTNNLAAKLRAATPSEPLPADKNRISGESILDYNKRLGIGAPL